MKLIDSINRIKEVAAALPDDDPDKLEMINTEGDYSSLMEWALTKRNEYLAMADANKELSNIYDGRKKSFENKAENMKEIVSWIMREAKETSFKGVSATVSIKAKPQSLVIIDETKIPDEFFKTERKLMKAELNQAFKDGREIDGVALDNGGEVLTIRSK